MTSRPQGPNKNSEDIVVAYEDQRDTRTSGMKGLDPVEISLKNLHYQDLSISYAQSDSEEDDVDKYSRVTPTFSQTVPKVNGCLDKTELYKTRPKGMIRSSVRYVPQV